MFLIVKTLENAKAKDFEDQNVVETFTQSAALAMNEPGVDGDAIVIKNVTESTGTNVANAKAGALDERDANNLSLQSNAITIVTVTFYIEFNAVNYESAVLGFEMASKKLISAVESGNFTIYLHEFAVIYGVSDSYENTTATSVEILVNLVPTPSPTIEDINRNRRRRNPRLWQIVVIVIACIIGCILVSFFVFMAHRMLGEASRRQRSVEPNGVVVRDVDF
jgi:hypothetical protein